MPSGGRTSSTSIGQQRVGLNYAGRAVSAAQKIAKSESKAARQQPAKGQWRCLFDEDNRSELAKYQDSQANNRRNEFIKAES